MTQVLSRPGVGVSHDRKFVRALGVFAPWRLQAYGYTLAAAYAGLLLYMYKTGVWLLDREGGVLYQDFTNMWVAGVQALHGEAALVYDPAAHLRAQEALVGAGHVHYTIWPYPPTYFLIAAPLALLRYVASFLTWEGLTLLGLAVVIFLIVRRRPAIALLLASPFTLWNIAAGQSGFLTASLLGASLLALERRPVVAGIFIGCLTYKPQWGILIPVALIAAKEWRAVACAAATTALLVMISIAAFGLVPWEAFPRELLAQAGVNLSVDPNISAIGFDPRAHWQYHQTIFGLIRVLHGGAELAWVAQGLTTIGGAVIVFLVWRSRIRYPLKAATLSAAALVATPYAFGYDMAAIAIPVAFLARDQIGHGALRAEQTLLLAMFGASLLCNFVSAPLEPLVVILLLCVILRRALVGYGTAFALA